MQQYDSPDRYFPIFLFDYYMSDNNRTKVIKMQSCLYFHFDVFPLFKNGNSWRFTERCFDPPPESIKVFNLSSRKGKSRENCNNILVDINQNYKMKNPNGKRIFIF